MHLSLRSVQSIFCFFFFDLSLPFNDYVGKLGKKGFRKFKRNRKIGSDKELRRAHRVSKGEIRKWRALRALGGTNTVVSTANSWDLSRQSSFESQQNNSTHGNVSSRRSMENKFVQSEKRSWCVSPKRRAQQVGPRRVRLRRLGPKFRVFSVPPTCSLFLSLSVGVSWNFGGV